MTLHRMHDSGVVFLSVVAAKRALEISHDMWEDVILVVRQVMEGLQNPLKLAATVTAMAEESNEVHITPIRHRCLYLY